MTAPAAPGPGAPGDGATTGGQAPAGVTQPSTTPAGTQGPGAPAQTPAEDVKSLPQWAQDLLDKTRTEAGDHRKAKEAAVRDAQTANDQRAAILKTLGLTPEGKDEPLTQEQIDEKLAEAHDQTWSTQVENVLLRTGNVNSDKLLDSMTFLGTLDQFTDLDPRSKEFGDKLTKHIAQYVKDHPEYATEATSGAARSGGDHPGGAGAARARPSLYGAVDAAIKRGRTGGR